MKNQNTATNIPANSKSVAIASAPRDLSRHSRAVAKILAQLNDATFECFSDALSAACGDQCAGKDRAIRVERALGNLARGRNKLGGNSVTNMHHVASAMIAGHQADGSSFKDIVSKIVQKVESSGHRVSGMTGTAAESLF